MGGNEFGLLESILTVVGIAIGVIADELLYFEREWIVDESEDTGPETGPTGEN